MDDLAKRRLLERFGLAGDATPKPEYERLPLREVPLEPIARALKDAADEIERLRAQLAERDRDAERYRWLRTVPRSINYDERRALMVFNYWCAHHELDAAIDAAMALPNKINPVV